MSVSDGTRRGQESVAGQRQGPSSSVRRGEGRDATRVLSLYRDGDVGGHFSNPVMYKGGN